MMDNTTNTGMTTTGTTTTEIVTGSSTTTTSTIDSTSSSVLRTIIHSTSGASIKIHTYGATVVSYITASNTTTATTTTTNSSREQLFLSKNAVIDGTKPIRGGIPIVFPIFGPPPQLQQQQVQVQQNTMPQHGFARRSIWTIINEYDTVDYAGIVLELDCKHINNTNNNSIIASDSIGTNNDWYNGMYNNCVLQYTVNFNNSYMTNILSISNNDTTISIPFQSLLHTYYHIDNNLAFDNTICYVKNLINNYTMIEDKVNNDNTERKKEEQGNDILTLSSEVDRVYSPKHKTVVVIKDDDTNTILTIGVGKETTIKVQCSGTISPITIQNNNNDNIILGKDQPEQKQQQEVSYVVWNPYIEKAKGMSDFDNNEYNDMICIEPGLLYSNNNNYSVNTAGSRKPMIVLQPIHVATLTQTMYV